MSISNGFRQKHRVLACAVATALACSLNAHADASRALERTVNVDIPPQRVSTALLTLSQQAGVQVLMPGEIADQQSTSGVQGQMSVEEALKKLLEGTSLRFKPAGENAVGIERTMSRTSESASTAPSSQPVSWRAVRMAQAGVDAATESEASEHADVTPQKALERVVLEEVVVTGSSIRGVRNEALPITVISSEQIRETGLATLPDVLQTLPQNFRGFPSVGGSIHADLRGIGSKYTLVLLNGRRVGTAYEDSGVDLALIPLATIERIEILTDGASAIYGADAIGGVINIITRKDFVGAETTGRFGASSGSYQTRRLTQSFGTGWDSGNVLINYSFNDQTMLRSDERGYTEASSISLMQPYENQAAYVALRQNVADAELWLEGTYSNRNTQTAYTFGNYDNEDEQVGVSLGARVALNAWELDFSAGLSAADTSYELGTFAAAASGDTGFAALNVSGALFTLPGGTAHLAAGAEYQVQKQRYEQVSEQVYSERRKTPSLFSEVIIPLVGAGNQKPGLKRLELTAAGRYDDYSDFGDVFKPKFSLLWSPLNNLNLRATWGESFKVPTLQESFYVTTPSLFVAYRSDPSSPSGRTLAVERTGYVEDLRPERSTAWSAGLDYRPESLPGARLSLTYSDIDFKDKIEWPDITFENASSYSGLVARRPDASDVAGNTVFDQTIADLVAAATTIYYIGGLPNTVDVPNVGAIIDNRSRNLSKMRVRSLDASMAYEWESPVGGFMTELSLTYLLDKWQQLTPVLPRVEVMDQVEAPVRLRGRAHLGWRRSLWSANLFVNYTDGYDDVRTIAEGPIDSWVTLDVNARYEFGPQAPALLNGMSVALAVTNLLHERPPYVVQPDPTIAAYDSRNADPLGRVIALELTKRWGAR